MQLHKRRPLRPERLHPESVRLYEYLRLHRPGWLTHAYNVLGYSHSQFDLEVELPHPKGDRPVGRLRLPATPITLWMNYGEEVSVAYWTWHAHPGTCAGGVVEAEAIMSDETVFVGQFGAGKSLGAGSCPPARVDEMIESARLYTPGLEEIIVRSWSGRMDRRIRFDARGRRK